MSGVVATTGATPLRVRPVAPPAPDHAVRGAARAADRASRGARPPDDAARGARTPLRPEQAEQVRRLAERWRSFPDKIGAPRVDWSARASRRAGWHASPRFGRSAKSASLEGLRASGAPDTLRVAFIRIDFLTDRGGDASTGDGKFDLSGPDTNAIPIDPPPHNRTFFQKHAEALSRYYGVETYGRSVVIGDVWPRTENLAYHFTDMADLGPWRFSQDIYPQAVAMFRGFLFAADSQSIALGDRIPWHNYDRFVLVHAGSDLQSDIRQDSKEDIPTFTLGVVDTDRVVFKDSTVCNPSADPSDPLAKYCPIDRCTFLPELGSQDGFYGTINAVLAHESGHNFYGFDDVYDIETGRPIVGYWSLMDSGNQVGATVLLKDGSELFATGLLPPSVDPFQRQFCTDSLTFPEASDGDTMTIQNGERHADMRKVTLSSDEYLLLENRYQYPAAQVELDQDSLTHVILGPKTPDAAEYDALLPGDGILVWHIDESVIPFATSLRINSDFGINTNPNRLGISIIEGDGLGDLGDPGSPFLFGAPTDPFFFFNNPTLSDTTVPNLIPNQKTKPHRQLDFLDNPSLTMHVSAHRAWQLAGWPIHGDFPDAGPQLLAVDADGDRYPEVCWAGGGASSPDSAALFAVRDNGQGLDSTGYAFAHLDRRPYPVMAAVPLGDTGGGPGIPPGPSWFAASTYAAGADTSSPGGRVWMVDWHGNPLPGWPAKLPSIVTTPPVILGLYPNILVFVGCANGAVYALDSTATVVESIGSLPGGVSGRLAVWGQVNGTSNFNAIVAAGGSQGDVTVLGFCSPCPITLLPPVTQWPAHLGGPGFAPDFLWINFDGTTPRSGTPTCGGSGPQLVVHNADHLWAFCPAGQPLPGWGHAAGDVLTDALGAGDPDGDGYPEVLTQTAHSGLAFWNVTGYPSPGWPKPGTSELLTTQSPPLALDVDGDGRSEVVGLNGSGVLAALRADGSQPAGWPLATGAGAKGAPVAADLNLDGTLEIVAPDRFDRLYAYSLPTTGGTPIATSWTMLGGDPGRTAALPLARTSTAPAAASGPLVQGSLKVYPNPARKHPVSFGFRLSEPGTVEWKIFDTSGHQVATFTRDAVQGENVQVWDTGKLPAGLYLARLRFKGVTSETSEIREVGLIR